MHVRPRDRPGTSCRDGESCRIAQRLAHWPPDQKSMQHSAIQLHAGRPVQSVPESLCRRRHCRRRVSLGVGTLAHDFSALTLLRVTLQVNERLRQTAPVRGPPPRGPPGPPGPWDRPRRPHVSIIGLLLCSSTFGAPQNLWSMVLYLTCPPCPWVLLQDAPPPYRGPPGLDPRGQHDYRDEGPPPARRPGLSSVVAPVEGSEGGDRSSERYSYGDERSEGGRSEGSRKRPAPGGALLEENVDVKRRNKRLFGAILGTLQRFRWAGSLQALQWLASDCCILHVHRCRCGVPGGAWISPPSLTCCRLN